jgi:hypothetical protein
MPFLKTLLILATHTSCVSLARLVKPRVKPNMTLYHTTHVAKGADPSDPNMGPHPEGTCHPLTGVEHVKLTLEAEL